MGSLIMVKCCSPLKAWNEFRENREYLLLEGGLPLILVAGMGRSLVLRVHLLPVIATFERVVDGTLHSLLQLNVSWDRIKLRSSE